MRLLQGNHLSASPTGKLQGSGPVGLPAADVHGREPKPALLRGNRRGNLDNEARRHLQGYPARPHGRHACSAHGEPASSGNQRHADRPGTRHTPTSGTERGTHRPHTCTTPSAYAADLQ
eukprot:7812300-Alexandrium_andersonii.AAC.1